MFNFNGITRVIENPKGHAPGYNYSLVGAVPASMMDAKPATAADVMAGRSHGGIAYHGRKWETVQEILDAAAKLPEVRMCNSPGCACRKLF